MAQHDDELKRRQERREAMRRKQRAQAKRMKLMLGLADIEDERTDEIITLLIIDRIRLPRSIK